MIREAGDIGAFCAALSALAGWLPPIAALLSIVWLTIRIYEYVRWVRRGRKEPRIVQHLDDAPGLSEKEERCGGDVGRRGAVVKKGLTD